MLSIETESRIARLFLVLAHKERDVEIKRVELAQQVHFNVYQVFCYLDKERKNALCVVDILDFLRRNGIYANIDEVRMLMWFYDEDGDGLLKYDEFVNVVLSNSNCTLRRIVSERSSGCWCSRKVLDYNVETALVNVFEKELELVRSVMELVVDVKKRFDFNVENVFDMIKGGDNITYESVKGFLKKNEAVFNEDDIRAVIKRLDVNKDKYVDVKEFKAFFMFPEGWGCKCGCCCCCSCKMQNRVCNVVNNNNNNNTITPRNNEHNGGSSNKEVISNLALRMSPQRKYSPRRTLSPLRYDTSSLSSLYNTTTQQQPNVSVIMNNNNVNASLNMQTPINTYIPYDKQPNNNLFLLYIKDIITYETQIENAKIELSMHNEFNVEDAFRIFELDGRGYITNIDLKYGLSLLGIYTTPNDIKLLMRRLDLQHKGHLTYSDFFDLVTPYEKDYRTMIEHRITNNSIIRCSRGDNVFGIRTTICLQNLLRLVINAENDLERRRIEMSNSVKGMVSDVFGKIDKNGRGSVSDRDVNEYLQKNGMFCSERENGFVFIRFDKNRDGKVELWELNEEFK